MARLTLLNLNLHPRTHEGAPARNSQISLDPVTSSFGIATFGP